MTAIDKSPETWVKAAAIRAKNDQRATAFKILLNQAGLPMPVREYHFDASPEKRGWRFDFAWPSIDQPMGGVALEVDGGLFVRGRHNRGAAIIKTHEKLNHAAAQGWRLLYCTPTTLCSDAMITLVRQALTEKP